MKILIIFNKLKVVINWNSNYFSDKFTDPDIEEESMLEKQILWHVMYENIWSKTHKKIIRMKKW